MSGRTRYVRRVRGIDHKRHRFDAWVMRELRRLCEQDMALAYGGIGTFKPISIMELDRQP